MYFAFALSTSLIQCSKTTVDPNGLPPETQTGAGTFACKINGVNWQYKDPYYELLSTKPKISWEFDKSYLGGYLSIGALRYPDGKNSSDFIILVADSLNQANERKVNNSFFSDFGVKYLNYVANNSLCENFSTYSSNDTTKNYYSSGKLTITKLDQSAKIIAGTFYCTIKQTGCDTLKITDGRFDLKYQ